MPDYWQVKRAGAVLAYGPKETAPDKDFRAKLRKAGCKIYIDGKLCKA